MAVKNIDHDVYLFEELPDNRFFHDVAVWCNRMLPISKALGKRLENLYNDDCFFGIYRTSSVDYFDVFESGLKSKSGNLFKVNTDHLSDVDKNIFFCDSLFRFIYELKYSVNFSNCVGAYIISIPKNEVDFESSIIKSFNFDVSLLSKYIYGFIPINSVKLENFVFNSKFEKYHDKRR